MVGLLVSAVCVLSVAPLNILSAVEEDTITGARLDFPFIEDLESD
jgi:hypothetical protein